MANGQFQTFNPNQFGLNLPAAGSGSNDPRRLQTLVTNQGLRGGLQLGQIQQQALQQLLPRVFSQFGNLLATEGRTPQPVLNQQRSQIARATQVAQDAIAARQGGNIVSGLGEALLSGATQQGALAQAGLGVREEDMARQRQQQTLQLLLNALIGPVLEQQGQATSERTAAEGRLQQQKSAELAALGALFGGLGSAFSFGGGGG